MAPKKFPLGKPPPRQEATRCPCAGCIQEEEEEAGKEQQQQTGPKTKGKGKKKGLMRSEARLESPPTQRSRNLGVASVNTYLWLRSSMPMMSTPLETCPVTHLLTPRPPRNSTHMTPGNANILEDMEVAAAAEQASTP
ncbi:hypothetical protein GWK47_006486 [Chionoecetes opilio]|uniref:Uncharacterized protein n=1 Tax=Chionoecetes opilio TaxID=41210 RepID=A0A8J5CW67_CHIOP|nr:hypothetical protein GWK47_006486 [Chionoecetes opilio]